MAPFRDKMNPMRRIISLLLPWFVMIAVPIQGLAAASMANCGSRMAQAEATGPDVPACHREANPAENPVPSQGDLANLPVSGDCDGCAGCAVVSGVALVPASPRVGIALAGSTPIAFAGAPRAPHIASRLERPPRNVLA